MFSIIAILSLIAGATAAQVHNVPRLFPVGSDSSMLLDDAESVYNHGRIINGDNAVYTDHPHQLSLLIYNGAGYSHICGASVIDNEYVLTAAHCVDGQNVNNIAVAGNLTSFASPGNYFLIQISQVFMHENYNTGPGGFPNDIAVLKLASHNNNLEYNKIQVASGSYTFAGDECTITGWGLTESGSTSVLQKASVTVLSNSECVSEMAAVLGNGNYVLNQHICVKGMDGNGRGSCNGDSGGPLECGNLLAGATSWGISGCHQNGVVVYPSVYVRLTHFYSWINGKCGGCLN